MPVNQLLDPVAEDSAASKKNFIPIQVERIHAVDGVLDGDSNEPQF